MQSLNSPDLKSFLEVPKDHPFPIQNLPFGVVKRKDGTTHCASVIGDHIIDLAVLEKKDFFSFKDVFNSGSLNLFIEKGSQVWKETRQKLSELFRHDCSVIRDDPALYKECILSKKDVEMQLPVKVGDYTDFYSSEEHATNIGKMFRDPSNPLLPNWKRLPVAYHGRASSIIPSGTPVKRPHGQILEGENVIFSPCRRLDFELELAFIVGKNSKLGQPISVSEAEDYIFGFVLMNDWSARDIQKWEYQPLGPFVSKSFATSISSWIVFKDALEPFRIDGSKQDYEDMGYLKDSLKKSHYDLNLQVSLKTEDQSSEAVIAKTHAKHIYWSMRQQIAHHTITGCNLNVGDMMASGTISGKEKGTYGSLIELSWGGKEPVGIGNGKTRTFLEDGDELSISGFCQGDGYRIGLGEVRGKVLASSL